MRLTVNLTTIILFGAVCPNICFSQSISPQALEILTKSFDKIADIKNLNYSMIFVDSMYNGRFLQRNKIDTVYAKIINNTDELYLFKDGSAKLVTKDSLFILNTKPQKTVSVTDNWDSHEISQYRLKNILGNNRNFADSGVDTLRFCNNMGSATAYAIEIVYEKREWNNGTVKSKLKYDRIWIDKESWIPVKRRMYSSRIDDLNRESIDIYEYSIQFLENNPALNFSLNLFKDPGYRRTVTTNSTTTSLPLGSTPPDFSAKNLFTGKSKNLSSYKGKIILLDFWYLSCAPCRTLMPVLEKLNKKYDHKKFVIVGVNTIDNNSGEIIKYLTQKQFTYQQLYQTRKLKDLYKLTSFPTTLLIDISGHIKHIESGYSEDFENKITKMIDHELSK